MQNKKVIRLLLMMVVVSFSTLLTGQVPGSIITMSTDLPVGSTISFRLSASTGNTPVQIDFGDGILEDYLIDDGFGTTINNTLKVSNSIKVFGDTRAIRQIYCVGMHLTSLDVACNEFLTKLWCYDNLLSELDVSQNRFVEVLYCGANQLSAIDICSNGVLKDFRCNDNKINTLDVNNNIYLTHLDIKNNIFSSMDITKQVRLEYLNVDDNLLYALNVNSNPNLRFLSCADNYLTFATLPKLRNADLVYSYAPQKTVFLRDNYLVNETVDFRDQYQVEGEMTNYIWKTIQGAAVNDDVYYTENEGLITFKFAIVDSVYCELTNSFFPDLSGNHVLKTGLIKVEDSFVLDNQENAYGIVRIGDQIWMAENLRSTLYNDGTEIPLVTDNEAWTTLFSPAYCWYNNDQGGYAHPYGAIYNWYAVETGKLCPTGWHVPGDSEWTVLMDYLGGADMAGAKLKETGTAHWNSPNAGATNETGFTAVPAGFRFFLSGGYFYLGEHAYWWSSTKDNYTNAWHRGLYEGDGVSRYSTDKKDGFSVRCIKNEKIETDEPIFTIANCQGVSICSSVDNTPVLVDIGNGELQYKLIGTEYTWINFNYNSYELIKVYGDKSLITGLICSEAGATELDVTNMPALEELDISYSPVTEIDLTKNPNLKKLYCYWNNLSTLDLRHNPLLTDLDCSGNDIANLLLNPNAIFTSFNCSKNQLTSLDLIENQITGSFDCRLNKLSFSTIPEFITGNYAPQQAIDIPTQVSVDETVDLSNLNLVSTYYTDYKWYTKEGILLEYGGCYVMDDGITYFIKAPSDSIYCEMTNEYFPDFSDQNVLKTSCFWVSLTTEISQSGDTLKIWVEDNTVCIKGGNNALITIYDVTGKVIVQAKSCSGIQRFTVPAKSVYIINVKNENGQNRNSKVVVF